MKFKIVFSIFLLIILTSCQGNKPEINSLSVYVDNETKSELIIEITSETEEGTVYYVVVDSYDVDKYGEPTVQQVRDGFNSDYQGIIQYASKSREEVTLDNINNLKGERTYHVYSIIETEDFISQFVYGSRKGVYVENSQITPEITSISLSTDNLEVGELEVNIDINVSDVKIHYALIKEEEVLKYGEPTYDQILADVNSTYIGEIAVVYFENNSVNRIINELEEGSSYYLFAVLEYSDEYSKVYKTGQPATIKSDINKHLVISKKINGTEDIYIGTNAYGLPAIFKQDSNGNIKWSNVLEGDVINSNEFTSAHVTNDGGYIVVGYTNSKQGYLEDRLKKYEDCTEDNCSYNTDAMIIKYNANGELQWINSFGGSRTEQFEDVIILEDGYLAIGAFNSQDYDLAENLIENKICFNGDNCYYTYDGMMVKYDSKGQVQWTSFLGGSGNESLRNITKVNDGFIVVGASTSNDYLFADKHYDGKEINEVEGERETSDAFIIKFDNQGKIQWIDNFGGTSNDTFGKALVDNEGNYIVIGQSTSKDYDMSNLYYESNNEEGLSSNAVIIKYNKKGNRLWTKSFGGSGYDIFEDIVITNSNQYVVVGKSSSNDYDLNDANHGGECNDSWSFCPPTDGLIVIFDGQGNVIKYNSFGGTNDDSFYQVFVSDKGFEVLGNTTSNDHDFESLKEESEAYNIVWVLYDKNLNYQELHIR